VWRFIYNGSAQRPFFRALAKLPWPIVLSRASSSYIARNRLRACIHARLPPPFFRPCAPSATPFDIRAVRGGASLSISLLRAVSRPCASVGRTQRTRVRALHAPGRVRACVRDA